MHHLYGSNKDPGAMIFDSDFHPSDANVEIQAIVAILGRIAKCKWETFFIL